ncbi:MAG: hypothetical protein MHPDNHAH_02125 [Anaerolineales bacterium]|nr:hypothetical protein [Anaerolineales bacterium]
MSSNEWKSYKLGEIATFYNGRAYKNEEFKSFGTPIVRIQNLTGGGKTVYSDLELDANKYIENGDLIYAWSATFGPYIWKGSKSIYHYHIWKIECNEQLLDKQYFYYKLKVISDSLQDRGNGTLFVHITKAFIESFEISIPPIETQRHVASILSALDEKIELNRQTNATLEAIAQSIFREWFVDGEDIDDWEVGKLGDIAENIRRSVQPSEIEPDTPYIGLEHMPRGSIALSEWDTASDVMSNKYLFKQDEFLFGKLRPYFHKVGVAPLDGVSSTDILVVAPKEDDYYGVVLGHISSVDLINHTTAASTGTKMPRTNWSDIARYEIALPPKERAKQFSVFMKSVVQLIRSNIMEARALANIRDALLPKLMSGEIEVTDN